MGVSIVPSLVEPPPPLLSSPLADELPGAQPATTSSSSAAATSEHRLRDIAFMSLLWVHRCPPMSPPRPRGVRNSCCNFSGKRGSGQWGYGSDAQGDG